MLHNAFGALVCLYGCWLVRFDCYLIAEGHANQSLLAMFLSTVEYLGWQPWTALLPWLYIPVMGFIIMVSPPPRPRTTPKRRF